MSDPHVRNDDWTQPGTYEVAPNVFRIPLPLPNDGLKAVNVYAIADGDSLTLIDSGWALAEAREALTRALSVFGAELGDVSRFLITHVHRDHYTQAVALRDIYGTPISLGEGERETLNALTDPSFKAMGGHVAALRSHGADELVDRLFAGDVSPTRVLKFWQMPDVWLRDRQAVALPTRTLTVINTPGHTRGHVIYVDSLNGLLFAGDHVLPHITPSVGFEPVASRLPLQSYLHSLQLVRRLPEMKLLPAHGSVLTGMHERVDELLAHHDHRLSRVFDAVSDGAFTAFAVAFQLSWTGRNMSFDSLDPFNQMLAVFETAAHLDLLVEQDRLDGRTINGVVLYEARANVAKSDRD